MRILRYFKNPRKLIFPIGRRGFLKWISDKKYIDIAYQSQMGKKMNWDTPQTFNEKLQWLKLYNRQPEYSKMVDKYGVREYIAEKIGEEYLIPLLGVWEDVEDIDFESLPKQFVLKCTHDSGSVVICKDKEIFDCEKAKRKLNRFMKQNAFDYGREWPYKSLKPRIIAERYMTDGSEELADYKLHVFNGETKMILVCRDRFALSGLTEDFYSEKWEHLPVKRPEHTNAQKPIPKPEELGTMIELAGILAANIPFARIDFYLINHKVYFGEITFFPASGFKRFVPEEWDYKLGEWLDLPQIKN